MPYFTNNPSNVKMHIATFLYKNALLNYLACCQQMWEFYNKEEFWTYMLRNQFGKEFVERKPCYLSFRKFYKRIVWESGCVYIGKNKIAENGFKCSDNFSDLIDVFDDLYSFDGKKGFSLKASNVIKYDMVSDWSRKVQYKLALLTSHELVVFSMNSKVELLKVPNVKTMIDANFKIYYLLFNGELWCFEKYTMTPVPKLHSKNIDQVSKIPLSSRYYNSLLYLKGKNLYMLDLASDKFTHLLDGNIESFAGVYGSPNICVKLMNDNKYQIYNFMDGELRLVCADDGNYRLNNELYFKLDDDVLAECIVSSTKKLQIRKRKFP